MPDNTKGRQIVWLEYLDGKGSSPCTAILYHEKNCFMKYVLDGKEIITTPV